MRSSGWLFFAAERLGTLLLLVAAGALLAQLLVGAARTLRFGRVSPTDPPARHPSIVAGRMGEGRSDRRWAAALGAVAAPALSMLPAGDVSIFSFLFSIVGPLSTAGLVALGGTTMWRLGVLPRALARGGVLAAAVLAGLGMVLYPSALGVSGFDAYRLGYGGPALPVLLCALAGLGALRGAIIMPLWALLAAACWPLRLFGSTNLWDYVIDPLAWTAALVFLAATLPSRIRRSQI